MNKINKIRGSLLAGAIGDALGYQIEFQKGIKVKQVTKYNDDKGIISDDTQMTLFTANALLWRETRGKLKGIAMEYKDAIYLGYLDWLETQTGKKNEMQVSWIKNIKELRQKREPGNTCLSSLTSGIKGDLSMPINDSKGCGTIMRTAPIGLYINNPIDAGKVAAQSSALTHGHILATTSACMDTILINLLLNTDLNIEQALNKSINICKENIDFFKRKDCSSLFDLVNKAIELSKKDEDDTTAIKQLGEGWVAEEAFAIAIYSCLKYSNNIMDAIICAVNHDGDSDSTGAIAGNIIGAYLGYLEIDSYYIDNLELKDIILELADDLSRVVSINEESENIDDYWLSKYLYNDRNQKLKKKIVIPSIPTTEFKIREQYIDKDRLTQEKEDKVQLCNEKKWYEKIWQKFKKIFRK